jgi:hypothetical protein
MGNGCFSEQEIIFNSNETQQLFYYLGSVCARPDQFFSFLLGRFERCHLKRRKQTTSNLRSTNGRLSKLVDCMCGEIVSPGNTKGGSITVPLASRLTGLESAVWQLTIFAFICKTE